MVDKDLNITWVNEAVEKAHGRDIIGKKCYEAVHDRKEPCEIHTCSAIQTFQDGKAHQNDIRLTDKNGKVTYCHCVTNVASRDDNGNPVIVMEIFRDVTRFKKLEAALLQSNRRYRCILEQSPVGIGLATPDGRIIYANKAMVSIFGYTSVELKKINLDDIYENLQDRKRLLELLNRDGRVSNFMTRFKRKDGTLYDVLLNTSKVKIGDRDLLQTICVDVTEHKKAEKKLLDYQKQLRLLSSEAFLAAEHERRRLATGIHNNISQKLALAKIKLQSLTNLTSDENISDPIAEVCEEIEQTVQELHNLTFEMSNPVLYELGLEAAIKHWLTEQIQSKHKIECKFTADAMLPRLDNKISVILFEAVRELLVNVIKYARAKTVNVHIRKAENKILIDVEDDGVGFIPSKLDSVLLQGKRGGFGLFSVKERLEYLGGDMNIKSSPGKGTCITLTVPLGNKKS
jgi:PAS domain S-box-containing protein